MRAHDRNSLARNVSLKTHHFECTHKKIHSYVHIDAQLLVYSVSPNHPITLLFSSLLSHSLSPPPSVLFFSAGLVFSSPYSDANLHCNQKRRA